MSSVRIDHIGIAVESLEEALKFYEAALGLATKDFLTVAEEKVKVAMLPAGEPRIELLEATSADSAIARFIAKRGEGLHHIALRVPDLPAAVERLKAQGARLASEAIRTGAESYRYVFVHPRSAHGVLIELIEEIPEGEARRPSV
jgi:methylmalonyl-CoA epimerase